MNCVNDFLLILVSCIDIFSRIALFIIIFSFKLSSKICMAISLDFNPISASGSGIRPVDITEEIEKKRIKEMSFHLESKIRM